MTDTIIEHADPTLKAGTPLVEMENVGKAYGAIRALEGINLRVNAGEVACVLGDNGAGKSTLIKIISGLHPHTEGKLTVDGQEVHFSSPRAVAGPRHRHRLPGPGGGRADGGVAQLLPRLRADQGQLPAGPAGHRRDAADRRRRAQEDGHHRQGHQPAHRHPVRRATPMRGHRPRRLLRRPGADPRRAHRRARGQAVRRGAEVHRGGPRRRARAWCSSPTTRTTRSWSATTSSS